jgi:hypothetical protein
MGANRTVLKEGINTNAQLERSYELAYESRQTFSSQLAGTHSFNAEATKFDWVLGYSFADKNQPDIRRIKMTTSDFEDPEAQYGISFSPVGAADSFGRLFMYNKEDILNAGLNFTQKIKIDKFQPELKAGAFFEKKQREFSNRVFTYAKSPSSRLYYGAVDSYNKTEAFDDAMFQSINDIVNNKIDYKTGLIVRDRSQNADNYTAGNQTIAGYLAMNFPFTKWFNLYAGVRVEQNDLELNGFKRDGTDNTPLIVKIDTLNIYPSFNSTINLNEKMMFRLAGGKTVNRPEFREVSPFAFYNFEENVTVYGNPDVRNSYISNMDGRFEWYPTSEEIISLGGFYKHFNDPIESKILHTGSGWNYTFHNADEAISYGLEFDARKRLHEFEKSTNLKFLSNITLVANASIIRSIVSTDSIAEGESQRVLQGQSPYIVNIGLYYNDSKNGIMGSAMYNQAGKRISIVGDINTPHIWEMPFNSLDFTFEKKIFEKISIKFGIKNALDGDVVFQQFQKYKTPAGEAAIREQVTNKYKPGRQFKLGVSVVM